MSNLPIPNDNLKKINLFLILKLGDDDLRKLMKHYLLLLCSLIALSQSANLFRLAEAPPQLIGFWRLFFAGLLILPFVFTHQPAKIELKIHLASKTSFWTTASGVMFFLHLWSYAYAAQSTKIANTMVIFAANPLFTALLSSLFFEHKITKKILFADLLAASGIYFMVAESFKLSSSNFWGDLSALASAFLYSLYILTGQQARHKLQNKNFTLILFFSAAFCFLMTNLFMGTNLISWPAHTWLATIALTISSTLIGHGLFVYLLKFLDINFMSCAKLIEPVLASLVASLIFGETVSANTWIAFLFTGTAVLVLFWPSHASK